MSRTQVDYAISKVNNCIKVTYATTYDPDYVPVLDLRLTTHPTPRFYYLDRDILLDWERETALSATSRADLFNKIVDLAQTYLTK